MKSLGMKNIALLALAMIIFTVSVLSGCDVSKSQLNKLYINEAMSSNNNSITDEDGEYSDWIELYNASDKDIGLEGYYLSDNLNTITQWKFPDVTIKAGEYMIVYASGKDKVEKSGRCHTNFKLSSNGDNVILSSGSVASVDTLTIPALGKNISFGRSEDQRSEDNPCGILLASTPGQKNSKKAENTNNGNTTDPSTIVSSGEILISEYMSKNGYICYDEDGDYSDWVELYNTTDSAITLSGYSMTTDVSEMTKWSFPNVSIGAKSYVTIWLSGKDKLTEKGEVHTNFKLGENDINLILASQSGSIIDSVSIEHLPDNISHGRDASNPEKWVYFSKPTPGQANNSLGFDTLSNARVLKNKGLWVSEVSAISVPYNDKDVSDWIEIYNGTDKAINLSGYGLSIDLVDKYSYTFGDKTINPGQYLMVYATGTKVPSKYASQPHTDFNISHKGETIYLTDPSGFTTDAYETGRLSLQYTSGRVGAEDTTRYFFTEGTPGAANTSQKYFSYTPKPSFEIEGGYVNAGAAVTISVPEGSKVRYTTDGTEPDSGSPEYTASITINKTTVVKAKAFTEGNLSSDTITATYIVGSTHSIPIISISINPDDFMGHNNGIWANGPGWTNVFPYSNANFWKDWERPITFEYYDASGVKQLDFNAGLKMFGQYSKGYDVKSMAVYLRGDYGTKSITYPFFENNSITTRSHFVLRTGGQDYRQALIRDAFASQVMKGNTSLIFMDWQPAALYINGEYFGLYNLREKINESYMSSHLGIDENNVDIIKGNKNVLEGTFDNYQELLDFVKGNDMSKAENYAKVENWVDIDNYIDYLITEIYFCNGDTGNVKFYRERKEGAKWQWVMFDFDMILRSDSVNGVTNSIAKLFNSSGHGHNNAFSTTLQFNLLKNQTFKNKFIERYAYHINNTFKPERMKEILTSMVNKVDKEIAAHCQRWGTDASPGSYASWKQQITDLEQIVNKRPEQAKKELKNFFGLSDARMKELFP